MSERRDDKQYCGTCNRDMPIGVYCGRCGRTITAPQSAVARLDTDDDLARILEAYVDAYASDTEGLSPLGWNEARKVMERAAVALRAQRSATARITPERISELWKQAMSEGAEHFVGFINRGLVPNFEHPENLTLPQRFAILLLAEMNA